MIVRRARHTLQLIRQPDHARLAGILVARSTALANNPRRVSILHAVAEHDNGWVEEDHEPCWNSTNGGVHDFMTAPDAMRQRVWPRGIGRLESDPWAAALVAQHADTIYDRYRGDAGWSTFFGEIDRLRRLMLQATGLSMDELMADYVWVRLGDLMSLSFCAGWTDEQRFERWSVRCAGDRVTVVPDLFDEAVIPFEVNARELSARSYRCEAELQAAWAQAAIVTLRGEIAGR